jgi:hypothetical protein
VVGLAVGFGAGVAAGLQLETPEPLAEPFGSGTRYFAGGSSPVVGKSVADSARIPGTSGIRIEPRLSKPERTKG